MTEDHGLVRLPRVQPFGDGALLATFGDRIEVALSRRIGALVAALDRLVGEGALAGVIDLVPSYTTLVVILDPLHADRAAVGETILTLWHDHGHGLDGNAFDREPAAGRTIEIPVRYGGEAGPDLMAVAERAGLTPDEVIARHAAGSYVVGALGFSPGFAFLIGLDPALATPRRATPRTAVPPGSVGIGGAQTGVYAQATPGGWSLIGRTPLRLARPEVADPARAFLMQGGDAVRFVPIDDARFAELEAEQASTALQSPEPGDGAAPAAVAFAVIVPGLQTTVQDLGRPGMGRYGISPGGAADRAALVEANRAVGNPDDAAGLEITLSGPALRLLRPLRIAVAGADLGAEANGFPLTRGSAYDLRAGDLLAFDQARAGVAPHGVRAYLAVAGGIEVPMVLGSRATDLTAGMGGLQGRPLQAGDVLRVGMTRRDGAASRGIPAVSSRGETTIRVVRGPQADRFDGAAWDTFLNGRFTVSSQSNRMGLRLDGLPIAPDGNAGGADLISEGMVTGAIQITSSGQPIVMLPARATIGGYAKIATVITADLDRLGQLRPGMALRFREVTVDEATAIAREDRPETGPGAFTPADREAVTALIRDFPALGLASLDVDHPQAGVSLRLKR